MSFRIYYVEGYFEYAHCDAHYMTANYHKTSKFLEAKTVEELKVKIKDFTDEYTKKSAENITLDLHDTDVDVNEIVHNIDNILDQEHQLFKFTSPILEVIEEFDSKSHFDETNRQFNRTIISGYNDHIARCKALELEILADRKAKEDVLRADPDYQRFLELKSKFDS